MALFIVLTNQWVIPSQYRFKVFANSTIASMRDRIAHPYHFLRASTRSNVTGSALNIRWKMSFIRYARPVFNCNDDIDCSFSFCFFVRFSGFLSQIYRVFFRSFSSTCSLRRVSSTALFSNFITWNLSKVICAGGKLSSIPLMNPGDKSQEKSVILSGEPPYLIR